VHRCLGVAGDPHDGDPGRPREVCLSRYEMQPWPAIGALAAVHTNDVRASDGHVSSRAAAAVTLDLTVCRLIGAGCRLLGCTCALLTGVLATVVITPYFPYRAACRDPS
jgi:hypothetical protein